VHSLATMAITNESRVYRYVQLKKLEADARIKAQKADDKGVRAEYLKMAEIWAELADDVALEHS
jgi:hypothetical protein